MIQEDLVKLMEKDKLKCADQFSQINQIQEKAVVAKADYERQIPGKQEELSKKLNQVEQKYAEIQRNDQLLINFSEQRRKDHQLYEQKRENLLVQLKVQNKHNKQQDNYKHHIQEVLQFNQKIIMSNQLRTMLRIQNLRASLHYQCNYVLTLIVNIINDLIEIIYGLKNSFNKTQQDFSKGKLLQIEYALNAVEKGDTAIRIKAKNGVLLVVEKKQSSILIEEKGLQKISLMSGFRVLSQQARKLVKKYDLKYKEEMFVSTLSRELAEDVQVATQRGGIRPSGVSIMIAGYDEEGSHLVQLDPSGAYYSWKATAIGKQAKNANSFLEKSAIGNYITIFSNLPFIYLKFQNVSLNPQNLINIFLNYRPIDISHCYFIQSFLIACNIA